MKQILVCRIGFLAAALLWPAFIANAGSGAAAPTNAPAAVVRKVASSRQAPIPIAPARPSAERTRAAALQAQLYFGPRVAPVTSAVSPQDPYGLQATTVNSYRKAVVGFRFGLSSRAYLFIGVGMAVSDDLLEQALTPNSRITAAQIQNALGMQTEYGLGWNF